MNTPTDTIPGELTDLSVHLGGAIITRILIGVCVGVGLLVLAAIIMGIATLMMNILPLVWATIVTIIFVAALAALYYIWQNHRQRRRREELSARLETASADRVLKILSAHVEDGIGDRKLFVELLGRKFLDLEAGNRTIRVGPEKWQTPIDPIRVPFEACPLVANDAQLEALSDALDATPIDDAADEAAEQPPHRRPKRARKPRFRRKTIYAVCVTLMLIGVTPTLIFGAWRDWLAIGAWATIGGTVGLVLRWSERRRWERRKPGVATELPSSAEWYAVPGGVLIRWPAPGGRHSRVEVIDRRHAVLFCLPAKAIAPVRMAYIVYRAGIVSRTLPPNAIDLLLRAWLSPLHPPPVEQLSDLIGDEEGQPDVDGR